VFARAPTGLRVTGTTMSAVVVGVAAKPTAPTVTTNFSPGRTGPSCAGTSAVARR
jgi:hypothetical protein